jgi:hypothetical protein
MFGLSTFAQAPFASLGGTKYDVATDESFSLSDVFDISKVDYAGLVDDSIALTDDVPNQFNYFLTNAETFDLADDYTGNLDSSAANDESISLTTTEAGAWNTSASLAETFSISEAVSTQVEFEAENDEASTLDTAENANANFVGLDEESITLTTTEAASSRVCRFK